jgi:hypothetical protein
MKRLVMMALLSGGLVSCATNDVATSAFDYTTSDNRNMDTSRFGYELAGDRSAWDASLRFEDSPGEPKLDFAMTRADGVQTGGELVIAMPYLENGVRRFSGVSDSGDAIEVALQAGPCEGAVADEVFGYFATVSINGQALTGCGFEVAAIDRWSNYLFDYLPAIDVCLAEFGGRSRHVSVAYPVGEATGVRVVDESGHTWECVTRDHDSAVNAMRPLDAADAVFGEGDPIFIRGGLPGFGEGCYVYEAIREANGVLIGSFGFDSCNSGPIS